MTLKRGIIYAVILSCVVTALCLLRRHDRKADAKITSTVLAPTDQEKLILDGRSHTITTVTRTGPVQRTYLPPHVTSVTVGKDGKVTVTSRKYGTELSPFVGLGISDKARLVMGVDLLYWQRWELGPFIGSTVTGPVSIRAGLKVSYDVWSNTSLFVGVDNTKSPVGGITWRF